MRAELSNQNTFSLELALAKTNQRGQMTGARGLQGMEHNQEGNRFLIYPGRDIYGMKKRPEAGPLCFGSFLGSAAASSVGVPIGKKSPGLRIGSDKARPLDLRQELRCKNGRSIFLGHRERCSEWTLLP